MSKQAAVQKGVGVTGGALKGGVPVAKSVVKVGSKTIATSPNSSSRSKQG